MKKLFNNIFRLIKESNSAWLTSSSSLNQFQLYQE